MKTDKKNLNILITGAIFLIAFISLPLSQLNFLNSMPGDIGDARLNNYFLENIYQFFFGTSYSLWALQFFSPFPYILGFSDNLFGSSPIYLFFRSFIEHEDTAFQLWFLFGYFANFIASYYVLRKLGASSLAASVGAAIFSFALPTTAHSGHVQLHYRFALPLAIYFLIDFLDKKKFGLLVSSLAWLLWQFYAGVYIGFFTLLLMGIIFTTYFLKNSLYRINRSEETLAFIKSWKEQSLKIKLSITLFLFIILVLLILLFWPYIQVKSLYGASRSWAEISSMLPRPESYILSDASIIWSTASASIFSSIPLRHEHQMFFGLIPIILAIGGITIGFMKQKNTLYYLMLSALIVPMILTLNIGGYSLWYFLHKLPLASAIRAMTRVDQALLFPLAYFSTLFIDWIICNKKRGVKFIALVITPLLIVEASATNMLTSQKAEWRNRVSNKLELIPKNVSTDSVLFFAQNSELFYADELDAMWASMKSGMKTINGYSGNLPPNYSTRFGSSCYELPKRILSYLSFSGNENSAEAYKALMSKVISIGFDNCDPSLLTELPKITTTNKIYTADEFRELSLINPSIEKNDSKYYLKFYVKNNADHVFSANSGLGKPIRVSWRYISKSDIPLSGWENRMGLPFDIPKNDTLKIEIPLLIDDTNELKAIEVSIVQELMFWGHDIGVKTVKVPLLDKVTRFIVTTKGKQMRPMFVFLCAKLVGNVNEKTYRGASMIELIHDLAPGAEILFHSAFNNPGAAGYP